MSAKDSYNYVFVFALPSIMTVGTIGIKYLRSEPILIQEIALTAILGLLTVGFLELLRVASRTWRFWVRFSAFAAIPVALLITLAIHSGPPPWWFTVAICAMVVGVIPIAMVIIAKSKTGKKEIETSDA